MGENVPNFLEYYFDVDEKLRLQQKLQDLLPQALILPGIFSDLGVIVEVSAFGGQIIWFEQGAPFIGEAIHDLKEIDSLKLPNARSQPVETPTGFSRLSSGSF